MRTPGGRLTDVTFADATGTRALDINDCGVIVGFYFTSDGATHGFYGQAGQLQTLDVPGAVVTRAYSVNSLGRIVGSYVDASGGAHLFETSEIQGANCE